MVFQILVPQWNAPLRVKFMGRLPSTTLELDPRQFHLVDDIGPSHGKGCFALLVEEIMSIGQKKLN